MAIFDGQRFGLACFKKTKREAEKVAKYHRDHGYKARVIKMVTKIDKKKATTVYNIYVKS